MKISSSYPVWLSSAALAALALALGACSTQSASTASASAAAPVTAAPAPASPAPVVAAPAPVVVAAAIDFDKQVKPFFAQYCAGCHGGARVRAGVHVDTKAGLLANITPGDAEHSDLYNAMGGPRKSMPPRNAPQPEAAELAIIKQWINEGAKISDSYPSGA